MRMTCSSFEGPACWPKAAIDMQTARRRNMADRSTGSILYLQLTRQRQAVGDQLVEGFRGWRKMQADFLVHAGFAPVAASHRRPLFAHVTGGDMAIRGKRKSHGQRTVAGKHAYFERFFRPHEADQQCHELSLLGSDLHSCSWIRRGLFAKPLQKLRLSKRDTCNVVEQIFTDR